MMRTNLGVTTMDDGTRLGHRTDRKRDLCIMACVFCKDPQFQAWLRSMAPDLGEVNEVMAKAFIIEACDVASRNELDTNPAAAERFHQLVRLPFLAWKESPFVEPAPGDQP